MPQFRAKNHKVKVNLELNQHLQSLTLYNQEVLLFYKELHKRPYPKTRNPYQTQKGNHNK